MKLSILIDKLIQIQENNKDHEVVIDHEEEMGWHEIGDVKMVMEGNKKLVNLAIDKS